MNLDQLDSLSTELLTIRSHSYISYAKIHSKNGVYMDLLRCFTLDLDINVVLRSFLAEHGTGGLRTSESISLVVS